MAGLTLRKYADHIRSIIYHKYNIEVRYLDLRFRYRNLTTVANTKYRFEIFGIVDYLPNNRREYLVYSEERTSDYQEWDVRIPEIYSELKPGQEENVSQITPLQNIYRGHDYNDPPYPGTGVAIGIYSSASIYSAPSFADGVFDNSISLQGMRYIPVNTSDLMGMFISQSYSRYNDYPGIKILSESTDENPTKMYYFIPWGVSGYKIILSSTNGEKDTTFIAGPLIQNNWQKATIPPILPNVPLGNPSQSVHLAHIVPNGVSLTSSPVGSNYQGANFDEYFITGFTKNSDGTVSSNNSSYGSLISKDKIAFPAGSTYKVTIRISISATDPRIAEAKLGIQFGRESSINASGNVAGSSNDGMQIIQPTPGTGEYVVNIVPNQYDKAENPASRIRIVYGDDGFGYGPGGNFTGIIESFRYEKV